MCKLPSCSCRRRRPSLRQQLGRTAKRQRSIRQSTTRTRVVRCALQHRRSWLAMRGNRYIGIPPLCATERPAYRPLSLLLPPEIGSYGGFTPRVSVNQRISHEGEVNRARYCPQNPDLLATRTVMGPTYIFDRTKHSLQPSTDGKCKPDIVLSGQEREGYVWQAGRLAGRADLVLCPISADLTLSALIAH